MGERWNIIPKKRILPYIILGLLAQHEGMTGRQITRQFQNEIGEFWKAAHSQIYPELRQMVQDKWIEKYVKADNDKEIYYKLLPLGKQKLTRWIEEPLEDFPVSQDLFSLKLFFIQDVNHPELHRLVQEEIQLLETQLSYLKTREQLLFPDGPDYHHAYGHYLILKRAIARLNSQLTWLKTLQV